MNKKLFVFDLDGTVLTIGDSYLNSSLETFKKIKKQKHFVAFASGRPLEDILKIGKPFYANADYFICNNGSYYYDVKKKQKVFDKLISQEVANDLFSLGLNNNCFFCLYTTDKVYRTDLGFNDKQLKDQIMEEEYHRFSFVNQDVVKKAIENTQITQVSLRSSKENIKKLFPIFNEKYLKQVKTRISAEVYLDNNPLGICKWEGIKKVTKLINVSLDNAITFGDSGNDIEMLENASTSFAMGNSIGEVKKAAKEVIGSNLTNAISETVDKLLRSYDD